MCCNLNCTAQAQWKTWQFGYYYEHSNFCSDHISEFVLPDYIVERIE